MDSQKQFLKLVEERKRKALEKKEAPLKWEQRLEASAKGLVDTNVKEDKSHKKHRRHRSSDSDSDQDAEEKKKRRKHRKHKRSKHSKKHRRGSGSESEEDNDESGSDDSRERRSHRERNRKHHKDQSGLLIGLVLVFHCHKLFWIGSWLYASTWLRFVCQFARFIFNTRVVVFVWSVVLCHTSPVFVPFHCECCVHYK